MGHRKGSSGGCRRGAARVRREARDRVSVRQFSFDFLFFLCWWLG
ncbi:putative pollen-specific leucine-rich repeat extensin-like protein 3 [Iris pallida]|uniref:Pollen-specific leucine-rich repeat extensin-like protein 3 n=1 Tax=Iris pallida TaxID=29817 RepID=A0AAX6GQX3_IRIPA|nr:putative pollen-specific leucine-rich repeat extensin-like protein 3 [Iris pallida]